MKSSRFTLASLAALAIMTTAAIAQDSRKDSETAVNRDETVITRLVGVSTIPVASVSSTPDSSLSTPASSLESSTDQQTTPSSSSDSQQSPTTSSSDTITSETPSSSVITPTSSSVVTSTATTSEIPSSTTVVSTTSAETSSSSSEESSDSELSSESDSESSAASDDSSSESDSESDSNGANNDGNNRSSGTSISGGAIAGIVVAIVVVLLGAIGYFLWYRKKHAQKLYKENDFVDFPNFDPTSNTDLSGVQYMHGAAYGAEKQPSRPVSSFAPSSFDGGYGHSNSNFGSTMEMSGSGMPPIAHAYNSSHGSIRNRNDDIFLRALDEN
ncbi:hypothetical protein EV175_000467 [Coemansia sp. RSA 1933]|nr:hypothetical protein EV175_000467 [Coemansia sp. RSA 1933]